MEPDDLYGLALSEFTAARDALAAELRSSGQREQAAAVKALRKPNAAAWAVNQLVRREPRMLSDLEQRAAAVAAAMAEPDLFADATRAWHATVGRWTEAAVAHAGASVRDKVMATLRSFPGLEGDAREQFTGGRLVRDLTPSGFPGIGAVPQRPAGQRAAGVPELASPRPDDRARRELEDARRMAAAAREEVLRLTSAADQAERAAEQAAGAARRAAEAATAARRRAVAAESRAEAAATRVEDLEACK